MDFLTYSKFGKRPNETGIKKIINSEKHPILDENTFDQRVNGIIKVIEKTQSINQYTKIEP